MKLYFKPGACSLATRIVLEELGIPYGAEQVDTRAGRTAGGDDYRRINPRGYVPALAWPDGTVLTESAAILQYLADTHEHAGLAPAYGSIARARLQQWLNVTASELHKAFGPFFDDPVPVGDAADLARARLFRVRRTLRAASRGSTRARQGRPDRRGGRGMTDERAAVDDLLRRYFDALYVSDADAIGRIFHPRAIYANADEDPPLYLSMREYVSVVARRPSPASRGEARHDVVESVEFAGENTALARVRCSIGDRRFLDFLSLVRDHGEWRIIAKLFQIVPGRI